MKLILPLVAVLVIPGCSLTRSSPSVNEARVQESDKSDAVDSKRTLKFEWRPANGS